MTRSRQELEQRLAEINAKMASASHWGALLSALSEERKSIEHTLRWMNWKDSQENT